MTGERIAKLIARHGYCSRREAEQWVRDGRVSINAKVTTSPAINVSAQDVILIDGKPINAREEIRLWLFHKPRGCITSTRDPQGRSTIFDVLPKSLPRIITVGRLDYNTEGLLLLTNDGEVARQLELPKNQWERTYRVRVFSDKASGNWEGLRGKITIDKIHYWVEDIKKDKVQEGKNQWFTITLKEGKNREVRKLFNHIGMQVNRLIRVSYGPFQLGNLPLCSVKEVSASTIRKKLAL